MAKRVETREQRYLSKMATAVKLPFAVATVNFTENANVAYLARSVACFGGSEVHVIGKIPDNKDLVKYSGTHSRFIKFYQYKTPQDLIDYCRNNDYLIVSAELVEGAIDLHKITFPKGVKIMFVMGNESDGVPVDILRASDIVTFVPMIGFGYCLNTSQTGNIILYEYAKQVG